MTNEPTTPKREVSFLLKVTMKDDGRAENNPIDIKLDLNPDNKIVGIEDSLSTKKELVGIFTRIIDLIEKLDERTSEYSKILKIDEDLRRKLEFSEDSLKGKYDANFQPPFEKIDKIIYRHESPGVASVSYARSYNGDKKPTL